MQLSLRAALAAELAVALAQLLRLQDAAKVTGYVCGIDVLEHSGEAWSYAHYSLIETALGIGVAVSVSLIPRLIRMDETHYKNRNPKLKNKNPTYSLSAASFGFCGLNF